MADVNSRNGYLGLAVIALIAVIVIVFLVQPKEEPSGKFGEAAEELSDGVEGAVRELDPHRTTGEKIGDAIDDAGEDLEDATDR